MTGKDKEAAPGPLRKGHSRQGAQSLQRPSGGRDQGQGQEFWEDGPGQAEAEAGSWDGRLIKGFIPVPGQGLQWIWGKQEPWSLSYLQLQGDITFLPGAWKSLALCPESKANCCSLRWKTGAQEENTYPRVLSL